MLPDVYISRAIDQRKHDIAVQLPDILDLLDLVREHFGTIIPADDNKFSALNSAVWSGGSFVYVPPGVHIDIPLQAYFRINAENMGQFERTLIIADEGSYVHYIEGCTAPTYTSNSLHSAVVELIAKPNARIRYSTIQNWSHNTYNLVTKRAVAEENATVEWVDGNLGSKLTMKYPAVYLTGEGARGEILSVAYAGDGQHQDAGGKVVHAAPNTSSAATSAGPTQVVTISAGRTASPAHCAKSPSAIPTASVAKAATVLSCATSTASGVDVSSTSPAPS